jgi:TM2 domain-containing membrane protein YozV
MEKVWEIKDPDSYLRKKRRKRPQAVEKDPVKALNRSLLFWGGGQIYNDDLTKGSTFLIAMVFLLAVTAILLTNYDQLLPSLREHNIRLSDAFLVLEAVLFLSTLFWIFNAGDAYYHAQRTRRTPFRGVNSKLAPALASLFLPGWGQFLNGQQMKASIYSGLAVIGIFSVLSVVLTSLAWPLLDASDSRFLVEGIFAVSLIILPFVPLLHLVSAFDALKVSLDILKKEPLWERIKATYYRARTQGFVKGIVPGIKGAVLLVLVLTFFVVIVYYWFPKGFYVAQMMMVKRALSEKGMTIIPEMINLLLTRMRGAVG